MEFSAIEWARANPSPHQFDYAAEDAAINLSPHYR
jgi:hypothetical protein